MRKTLCLVLALTFLLSAAAFGQDFFSPPPLATRNASGFMYYMLEVPDGWTMTADNEADDWAWFDPEYVLTNDEWADEGNRPLPSRDDLDVTTMMAWKGAPENRWYVHMVIHDDTLAHAGNNIARWSGDMFSFALDPQDHGRDRGNGGFSLEWYAAPGDVSPNWAYRYPTGDAEPGIMAWLEYGEEPWMYFALKVDPQEAWAADPYWTSDLGGETYYEFNVVVVDELLDGGPSASAVRDLDAVAGEDGMGLPFTFWVEDGEGGGDHTFNDWTVRGSEASGGDPQYFAASRLLRVGEYTPQSTAVESSTWGRIKSSF
jgi:hypothetical protein